MTLPTEYSQIDVERRVGSDRRWQQLEPWTSDPSVVISTRLIHEKIQNIHRTILERATGGRLTWRGNQIVQTDFSRKFHRLFSIVQLMTAAICCQHKKENEAPKMQYIPGDNYYSQFTTQHPDTAVATNTDSLPTATATRNGTDDATFVLTVTNMATGRYKVTGTVPAGYAAGDIVQIIISATVATLAATAVVDQFRIESVTSSGVKTAIEDGALLGSVADTVATTTSFKVDAAVFPNTSDFGKQSYIRFLDGQNRGIAKPISSYVFSAPDVTVTLTAADALPFAPANGDRIEIIGFYK